MMKHEMELRTLEGQVSIKDIWFILSTDFLTPDFRYNMFLKLIWILLSECLSSDCELSFVHLTIFIIGVLCTTNTRLYLLTCIMIMNKLQVK